MTVIAKKSVLMGSVGNHIHQYHHRPGFYELCLYGIRELVMISTNQNTVSGLIWTNERSALWPRQWTVTREPR